MITAFIVVSSLVLAAAFTIAWLTRPELRRRIEEPKYGFQEQLQRYNRQVEDDQDNLSVNADES